MSDFVSRFRNRAFSYVTDRTECTRADANLHRDKAEINYSSILSNQKRPHAIMWLNHCNAISKWPRAVFASFFKSGEKYKVQDSNEALSEKQAKLSEGRKSKPDN